MKVPLILQNGQGNSAGKPWFGEMRDWKLEMVVKEGEQETLPPMNLVWPFFFFYQTDSHADRPKEKAVTVLLLLRAGVLHSKSTAGPFRTRW
jgi:hypothetical protein